MQLDSAWVVTDGKAGMEVQCLGVAEALGLAPVVKRVALRPLWRLVSPYIRFRLSRAAGPAGDPVAPPWPDIVIATGRQSIAPALAAKRGSGGRSYLVQLQNPVIGPHHFDLVAVPQHDRLRGDNVVTTIGAPNRVTESRLNDAADRHGARLSALPRPRIAVLIGGGNSAFRLTSERMGAIAADIAAMAGREGAGLMVTASRRTGPENEAVLRTQLEGLPAEIWDGTGDNPYFAYLALADAVLVTGDSINMVSEAASTGRPVNVIDLDGGSPKFARFHENLRAAGVTRPFDGRLETWTYRPLNDAAKVAGEIRRRLAAQSPEASAIHN